MGTKPAADMEQAAIDEVTDTRADESVEPETNTTDEHDDGSDMADSAADSEDPLDGDAEDEPIEDAASETGAWRRIRQAAVRWGAALVVAAIAGVAGYEGWLLFQHHREDIAATQAQAAAQKYAVTLTSTDPNAIDQNFADIIDGATGDFKDTYTKASSRLRKMLLDNKVATQSTVIDSAVKSAGPNSVDVLLIVRQSVTNSQSPDARIDLVAVTMTMEKIGDRWLASRVDLPAEQG